MRARGRASIVRHVQRRVWEHTSSLDVERRSSTSRSHMQNNTWPSERRSYVMSTRGSTTAPPPKEWRSGRSSQRAALRASGQIAAHRVASVCQRLAADVRRGGGEGSRGGQRPTGGTNTVYHTRTARPSISASLSAQQRRAGEEARPAGPSAGSLAGAAADPPHLLKV